MNYFTNHKKPIIIGAIIGVLFLFLMIIISYTCESHYRLPTNDGYYGTEEEVIGCFLPIMFPTLWIWEFFQTTILHKDEVSENWGMIIFFFTFYPVLGGLIGLTISKLKQR